jgi:hypothetical protein
MANKGQNTGWLGFNALGPGPLRDRIKTVLSIINSRQLEKVALATRLQQDRMSNPGIICTIDPSRFTHGFNNIVLELNFSDSVFWIARIQHISVDPSEARENAMDLLSESQR